MTDSLRYLLAAGFTLLLGACDSSESGAESSATAPQVDPARAQNALATAERLAENEGKAPPAMPPGHPPVAADPHGRTPGNGQQAVPPNAAGGLVWEVQEPLVAKAPASSMRAAEYHVEGDAGPAVLTVFYFGAGQGGSVQANLDRWIAQFSQPDGSSNEQAAKIEDHEFAGLAVKTLDLKGTFGGGSAPMMGQPSEPKTDHRVLGAIVTGPKGPVFFKMVGPASTIAKAESAFTRLIESVHPG